MSSQTEHDNTDEEEKSQLTCLTRNRTTPSDGSRRITLPRKWLEDFNITNKDEFDVVMRGYDDGTLVIELPESVRN